MSLPSLHRDGALPALAMLLLVVLAGCTFALGTGSEAETEDIRFQEVASEAGLQYNATDPLSFGNGRVGVYTIDANGDPYPDLLTIGGDDPALFENGGGEFQRSDALPDIEPRIKGALVFDYDRDGQEDILLLPINGTPVFLENRDGSFHRKDVGFDVTLSIGSGATAADYDGDGCPDVFLFQNGDWREHSPQRVLNWNASTDEATPVTEDNGNPNYLFEGDCSEFERVDDAGISGSHWSTAASFVDVTGDGSPDIHVANDFYRDTLYVNEGDGTFSRREIPDTNRHGMASEIADVNGDHAPDVFVSNVGFDQQIWSHISIPTMGNRGNNLLVNEGHGRFSSQERRYGVANGGWGWAASLVDLDNDGDRDLVHTTRDYRNYTGEENPVPTGDLVKTRPSIWERGDDRFHERSASAAGFELSNGKGMATLDYDLDGDQDLVVTNSDGPFKLYENQRTGGDWLQVRPVGANNATAIGAEVYVTTGNRTQYEPLNVKADFRSQDSRTLHFGLGDARTAELRIVWPDGTVRTVSVDANRRLVVPKHGPIRTVSAADDEGLFGFLGL